MTAILVLLAILSLATLATRQGGAEQFVTLASAPLVVTAGIVLSPDGLAFLLPSTAAALTPALRVGVAWLALLAGLRMRSPLESNWLRDAGWVLFFGGIAWLMCAASGWAAVTVMERSSVHMATLVDGSAPSWALCLAMGGMVTATNLGAVLDAAQSWPESPQRRRLIFMARHDSAFGAMGLVAVMMFWVQWDAPTVAHARALPMIAVGALGAVMAAGALMLGAARQHVTTTARLSMLSLVVAGAGLCGMSGVPESAATLFMGFLIVCVGASQRLLSDGMRQTDRPVGLALLLLAGVHAELSMAAVIVGAALSMGRLASRLFLGLLLRPPMPDELRPSTLLTSPALTVAYAMSLTLARKSEFNATVVLTAVVLSVCINDLMTLLWGFGQRARSGSITLTSMPIVKEPRA